MENGKINDGAQEHHWTGRKGDQYTQRNDIDETNIANQVPQWKRSFRKAEGITSLIEFGTNCGPNLRSIVQAFPALQVSGVEINKKAADLAKERLPEANIFNENIVTFNSDLRWDLVLIKGVLIHITKEEKYHAALANLDKYAKKFVLIVDHVSQDPTKVQYYGRDDLWLVRNFPIDFIDRFPSWKIIDIGHWSRNDIGDGLRDDCRDVRWFLLGK
ncbi:hypothetical protein K1718_20435 [Roseibium porphyridii]|uniref:Methyltransferase type 12 domain-containing protein n=1 Tax=Roseibium porphyridii TaxID=2866279 RepID=A0ABY8EZC8_9HYPH|nr:pseudaminic acid biosynthesis-associated methylase [Roseibium sp. KMA01]WFE88511.1 hypothetical protein K1718_20435 [Roseibium sp. KMA01]